MLSALSIGRIEDGFQETLQTLEQYVARAGQPDVPHIEALLDGLTTSQVGRRLGAAAHAVAVSAAAAVALAPVVIVSLVLMAIATATVFYASYVPNYTFGTVDDYVKLALAAVGSASVAGILASALLLRGPADWFA